MEMKYVTYYEKDGRITGYAGGSPSNINLNKMMSSSLCVDGKYEETTHFIKDGKARPRPQMGTNLEGSRLKNVPIPSLITINGVEYPCNESEVALEFDQPGTYKIIISSWPYLDKEFTYENPPQ